MSKTMSYKRAIAVISDTHVGSKYALFPEEFETEEGHIIKANPGQKKIYEYWKYFLGEVCDFWEVDTIIHLGDALEGIDRRNAGEGLILSNLEDEKDCFEELMKPFLENRQFLIVSGSTYHQSLDTKVHRDLAKRLKGKYCGYVKNIKLKGTKRTINIAHSIGFPLIYISTYLDREGFFLKIAEAMGKLPKIDVVLRAHIHLFEHIHLPQQHLVLAPCWKAYQHIISSSKYGRKQPDIGGVIILIDECDRIIVHHYLMENVPHIEDYIMRV